jgi:hypothetical protein
MSLKSLSQLIGKLRQTLGALPDRRTGSNTTYSMQDIGLSAFSVFFMQSPSFLDYQKSMQKNKGQSNAQSLFEIGCIPTDNHIRAVLDPLQPNELFPVFDELYGALKEQGILQNFRGVADTQLIALDGTWYHSSHKIHCQNCSHLEHQNGPTTYYHSAITPVVLAPGQPQVIALRPEFITPQDGQSKQDCEINAAKRWLEQHSAQYQKTPSTLLGDDLYAHQPFCRRALLYNFHFIFVCKPDSHKSLYQWVQDLEPARELRTLRTRVKKGGRWLTHTYRWANHAPLVDEDEALKVNWCELSVTDEQGQVLYHNAFITDFKLSQNNVAAVVASGRARWKIENENNNTLKTKGYHLEHNFGHGKEYLSSLLATFNLLAFLFHTFLSFTDGSYQLIRSELPSRQTFFDDLRALTRYLCFESWEGLLDFMMRGLEIGPYAAEP